MSISDFLKNAIATKVARWQTDASGNVTGLVGPDGDAYRLSAPGVRSIAGSVALDLVSLSGLPAGASFSGAGSYASAGVLAVQSTGTITHNPTGWYDGTACLDFVPNTDSSAEFRIYIAAGVNISDDDGLGFRFGIPEVDTTKQNFSIKFEYSVDATNLFPTNKGIMDIWRCDQTVAQTKEKAGEKYIRQRWDHDTTNANCGAWPGNGQSTTGTGADRTANVKFIRFACNKFDGKTIKFKSVLKGGRSTPCLVLGSDNANPEELAVRAFAYMAQKQLPGYIDQYLSNLTGAAGALVNRVYSAGFEVCGNDTQDRALGSTVTDESTMRSAIVTTRDTLRSQGYIYGSNVWISNNNSSSYLMIRELEAAGYVANRNGQTDGRYIFPEGGVKDPYRLPSISIDNTATATVQEYIDRAITVGCTLWMYWHGVLSSNRIDADRTANVTGTSGAPIARSGTETLTQYRARAAALGTAAGTASVAYFDARIGSAALGVWWEDLKTVLDYIVTKRSSGDLVVRSPEEWCRDVGLL